MNTPPEGKAGCPQRVSQDNAHYHTPSLIPNLTVPNSHGIKSISLPPLSFSPHTPTQGLRQRSKSQV